MLSAVTIIPRQNCLGKASMKTLAITLIGAAALAACVPSEPTVTDFNGDSVKIAVTNFAGEGQTPSAATDAEALRICTKGGKRTAEYASSRWINDVQFEHLYLCL